MRPSDKAFLPLVIASLLPMLVAASAHARQTTRPASTAPAAGVAVVPSKASLTEILAHGTEDAYWIARVEPPDPDTGLRRTFVQMRGNASDRWRAVGKLEARAVSLTNRGTDLAVLLESGQWMLMWPGGGTIGQPLPGSAQLLALAGDSRSLWALGRGDGGAGSPATRATTPATSPTTGPTVPGLALFEWDVRGWVLRAPLPDSLVVNGPRDVSMALESGRPLVALRTRAGEVEIIRLGEDGGLVGELKLDEAARFKLVASGTRHGLWLASIGPAGSFLPLDQQASAKPLAPPEGLTDGQHVALTSATGQLRLVYFRGNDLFEQGYSWAGEPTGTPAKLAKVDPPTPETLPGELLVALLLLLTFFVFAPAGKRGSGEVAIRPSGSGLSLASDEDDADGASRASGSRAVATAASPRVRLQAGLVDAIPLIVAICVVRLRSVDGSAGDDASSAPIGSVWYFAIASAVYFLHTVLGELFTGRTIGKALFGLRVTTLKGERPRPVAIVLRNLIRVFEAVLPISFVVALFTPLHQRIGDMATGTVVVTDEKPDDDEDDETRDDSNSA